MVTEDMKKQCISVLDSLPAKLAPEEAAAFSSLLYA